MFTNEEIFILRVVRSGVVRGGVFLTLLLSWQQARLQATPQSMATPQRDLTRTSIEDLMNIEVTSASKKEQKLSQVAGAIFVITQEDIRSSGIPVLTVWESEHFAQEGGMIGFFLEDNKVRFEINLTAAERAKLKISGRLLSRAKTVIGGPKGT